MSDIKPRERRQQRTRQAILQTALQLVREKGADNLSLREIARRIDYSPAGLYEYFGSKDELIEAVCNEADERFYDTLDAVPTSLPIDEYLLQMGLAYIQFAEQNPEQFLFLFANRELDADVTFQDAIDADGEKDSFMILYRAILRGLEEGILSQKEGYGVMEISYSFWACVHGMAMLQLQYLKNLDFDFDTANRNAIETLIRGFA